MSFLVLVADGFCVGFVLFWFILLALIRWFVVLVSGFWLMRCLDLVIAICSVVVLPVGAFWWGVRWFWFSGFGCYVFGWFRFGLVVVWLCFACLFRLVVMRFGMRLLWVLCLCIVWEVVGVCVRVVGVVLRCSSVSFGFVCFDLCLLWFDCIWLRAVLVLWHWLMGGWLVCGLACGGGFGFSCFGWFGLVLVGGWFCVSLLVAFYGGLVDSGVFAGFTVWFRFFGFAGGFGVGVGGLVLTVVVLDGSLVCFLLCS